MGVKCVKGAFNSSNRLVPSRKTLTSYLARNNPFSKGSGILGPETKPLTPLTVSGIFCRRFEEALTKASLMSISLVE